MFYLFSEALSHHKVLMAQKHESFLPDYSAASSLRAAFFLG